MTDWTKFVFSQVQKPESLSCDRDALLRYYLIDVVGCFLYSKSGHSLAEKFCLLPLL